MSIKFTKLSPVLFTVALASSLMTGVAQAGSVSETMQKAYFENSGDAFKNASIWGQVQFLFGPNGFAETKIRRDGKLVNIIYHDVMKQQAESGSPIFTRDLRNPFSTSVAEYQRYRR